MSQSHGSKSLYIISTVFNGIPNPSGDASLKKFVALKKSSCIEITGTYEGRMENAFLIEANETFDDYMAHEVASLHNQYCFLKLVPHKHGMYKAYKLIVDTMDFEPAGQQFMGFMRSLAMTDIINLKLDWYHNPAADAFFTVWNTDTTFMQDFEEEIRAAKLKVHMKENAYDELSDMRHYVPPVSHLPYSAVYVPLV